MVNNLTKKRINLHLISDSTGETLGSISRAVLTQFEAVESKDFIWPLVKTRAQLHGIIEMIKKNPGIVLYTIVKDEMVEELRKECFKLGLPCISAISHIIAEFSSYLKMDVSRLSGAQHMLNSDYFSRVEAISYTMTHDDGKLNWDLFDADIILIGVSRTSKTPTSIYLSCRGYKTANIPFVSLETIPDSLMTLKKPLIVGLTVNPEKLMQIRQTRLSSIAAEHCSDYVDLEAIKSEIKESRKLFARLRCPVIDVTKSSVEETAAKVIRLIQENRNKADGVTDFEDNF